MAESRRAVLKKRVNNQWLQLRDVRGYFIYHANDYNNGVFCSDLDAVERHIKKVENENG